MKAVGYIRVSDTSQVEGYSLAAQQRIVEEYCESRGWTLAAIADEFEIRRNAVSSWRSGKHQPRQSVIVKRELQRMLGRRRIPKRRRMVRKSG